LTQANIYDHANTWLAQIFVGTTRISTVIHEILTVLCLVTRRRVGTSGSQINGDGVSTLKQGCSRRYSGRQSLVAEGSNAQRIEALLS
jgi:hypothetical protein